MVGLAEMGAPISLDGVAVHPHCWCVCLCYLHFASENPEDGKRYLLVPAHLSYPWQSPESCKMVVRVCVCVCAWICLEDGSNSQLCVLYWWDVENWLSGAAVDVDADTGQHGDSFRHKWSWHKEEPERCFNKRTFHRSLFCSQLWCYNQSSFSI